MSAMSTLAAVRSRRHDRGRAPTLVLIAVAAVLAPSSPSEAGPCASPRWSSSWHSGSSWVPYVLKLAHVTSLVTALSDMGLTFLMFLAGYDLELSRVKGQPLEWPR